MNYLVHIIKRPPIKNVVGQPIITYYAKDYVDAITFYVWAEKIHKGATIELLKYEIVSSVKVK